MFRTSRSACSVLVLSCAVTALTSCSDRAEPVAPTVARPITANEKVDDAMWSAWSTPENLGPVINTADIEQHPTISRDGLSLYFASDRQGTMGALDIWVSHRESVDDPWGPPVNLGANINSAANDLAVAFSPNRHTMYYHSAGRGGCGGSDLFESRRKKVKDDLGWGVAVNLGCAVNSPFEDAGPTIWEDEETGVTTMLFNTNRPGGPGNFDIYQTTRVGDDGAWSTPVLVPELSGPFRDTRTTISRDHLTLFISSDIGGRIGGIGGQDVWVSTRPTTDSPWSTPVNLGSGVNSATFDGAPSLSWDGTELYFFSDRGGGYGKNDLYVTRRARLHP
jgi:WD40 repeat protein